MPADLEKIADEDIPAADTDVRGWWRAIAPAARVVNALLNFQIVTNSGRNFFSITEGNAVLELNIPVVSTATAVAFPWQPYLSPTATGLNAPFTLRIVPGDVTDGSMVWLPARENIEIVVPPNAKMYVWLEAGVAVTTRITSVDYGYGLALPDAVNLTDDGVPPPSSRKLLFIISTNATGLEFPPITQVCKTSLSLYPKTITQSAAGSTVVMDWQPTGDTSFLG